MSTRTSRGEAFIESHYVADIELHEEWVERLAPMPLPGTGRIGHKDLSGPGQAHVAFLSVTDPDLQLRLERLVEFVSADRERKRRMRDARQTAIAVDLVIGERNIIGARVDPPGSALGLVEDMWFPVALPA
jgi:hypothetical protein